MALPPQVSVDKFLRVAITALQQNPALLAQDRNSLFAAVVTSAQLGLLPDAQLGEAYFVPFKGKVQLIPGYRGLIKLARQGDIGQVEAEIIYANDKVVYLLGDESRLDIAVNWRDRGEMIAAYAIAKYRDGGIAARAVMMKEQIDVIRARSQAAGGPAWTDNYDEMAKKTVLRRLSKYLPLATEAQRAFRVSEAHEEQGRQVNIIEGGVVVGDDVTPEEPPQAKRKAPRTQLDTIESTATPVPAKSSEPRPEPVTDAHLRVDPETGEVIGGTDQFTGDAGEPV